MPPHLSVPAESMTVMEGKRGLLLHLARFKYPEVRGSEKYKTTKQ